MDNLAGGCLKMGWKYPLRFFRLQTYLSDMEVWNISSSKILMPKWNRCTTSSLGQCTYIMWYWLVWFKKQHAFLCFLFNKSLPNILTRTLNFEIMFLQKLWSNLKINFYKIFWLNQDIQKFNAIRMDQIPKSNQITYLIEPKTKW